MITRIFSRSIRRMTNGFSLIPSSIIPIFCALMAFFPMLLNAQFVGDMSGQSFDKDMVGINHNWTQSSDAGIQLRMENTSSTRYTWNLQSDFGTRDFFISYNEASSSQMSWDDMGASAFRLNQTGGMWVYDINSTSNYISLGHDGSNAYIDGEGSGGIEFLIDGSRVAKINSYGDFNVNSQMWIRSDGEIESNNYGIKADGQTRIGSLAYRDGYMLDVNGNVGVTGDVHISGLLDVDSGSISAYSIMGNAKIGSIHNGSIWSGISHAASSGDKDYALLQNDLGMTLLNAAAGQRLDFKIDNVHKMSLDADGEFGIGTYEPSEKLHVYDGNLRIEQTSTTAQLGLYSNGNNGFVLSQTTSGDAFIANGQTTGNMKFNVGGETSLQLNTNGSATFYSSGNNLATFRTTDFVSETSSYVEIMGSRSSCSNCVSSYLTFSNYDSDGDGNSGAVKKAMSRIDAGPKSTDNNNGFFRIKTLNNGTMTTAMTIDEEQNVAIGTNSVPGGYILALGGKMKAKGVVVDASDWADYVFEEDYELPSLESVGEYIHENGHLPEVPTTAEVEENGVDLSQMQTTLLKKMEEMTLYMLEMNDKFKTMQSEIDDLRAENKKLKR